MADSNDDNREQRARQLRLALARSLPPPLLRLRRQRLVRFVVAASVGGSVAWVGLESARALSLF